MLYGLETMPLTKKQEAELEVAELKMLCFSLGVIRSRMRTRNIRGIAHVDSTKNKLRKTRLRWNGHILRRKNNSSEKE